MPGRKQINQRIRTDESDVGKVYPMGHRSREGAMPTLKLWIGRPKEVRASLRDDPVGRGRLAAVVDFGQLDDISGKALYVVIPEMHYSRT